MKLGDDMNGYAAEGSRRPELLPIFVAIILRVPGTLATLARAKPKRIAA
jgi:hypothetical protein